MLPYRKNTAPSAGQTEKWGGRVAKDTIKLVAQNKKAHFEYFLEELFEAGLSLSGTEVKSLRLGKCSLKESFVRIEKGEAFLYNMHISPYEQGNIFNKDPLRTRKMLLHKSEIRRLIGKVKTDGYTIVPVRLYFKGNYARWRSHWQRVRNYMINVRISRKRISDARLKNPLKFKKCIDAVSIIGIKNWISEVL